MVAADQFLMDRYNVTMANAYIADFLAERGIVGETFETCCNWDRIDEVIGAAKAEAKRQHVERGLLGTPFISSRITQQYHTGVCIYFTCAPRALPLLAVAAGCRGSEGARALQMGTTTAASRTLSRRTRRCTLT